MDDALAAADAYLNGNPALKRALGLPESMSLAARPLGKGEHNLNYTFADPASGRRYVLRINVAAQPFHDCQVRYEYDALRALAPSGHTPRVYYVDHSADAPALGALVIEYCDGAELDFDHLSPEALRQAAAILADVHAIRPAPDCPLFRPRDPLLTLFDECVTRYEAYRRSPYADARVIGWVDRLLEAVRTRLAACPPAQTPDLGHIVHTEPLPSHFLLRSPDLGAAPGGSGWLIDWERPVIGEVAQDVAYVISPSCTLWDSDHWITPAEQAEFLDAYWEAVDGRFDRGAFDGRLAAWLAVTAFRSITWCCRSQEAARRGLPQSPKAAAKTPVYLSDETLSATLATCRSNGF